MSNNYYIIRNWLHRNHKLLYPFSIYQYKFSQKKLCFFSILSNQTTHLKRCNDGLLMGTIKTLIDLSCYYSLFTSSLLLQITFVIINRSVLLPGVIINDQFKFKATNQSEHKFLQKSVTLCVLIASTCGHQCLVC